MRQTNENTSVNLKLVMLFDWRRHIYCICSHNLSPDDASSEVTELRRDGLPAFTIDQRSRHLQDDAEESFWDSRWDGRPIAVGWSGILAVV